MFGRGRDDERRRRELTIALYLLSYELETVTSEQELAKLQIKAQALHDEIAALDRRQARLDGEAIHRRPN